MRASVNHSPTSCKKSAASGLLSQRVRGSDEIENIKTRSIKPFLAKT